MPSGAVFSCQLVSTNHQQCKDVKTDVHIYLSVYLYIYIYIWDNHIHI